MITNAQRATVTKIEFKEPLICLKTDRIEIDIPRGKAMVVNNAGKVKQVAGFRTFGVEVDGTLVTAGD